MIALITAAGTPRYRRDVLRAISQPVGSYLQFRYVRGLVKEPVWARLSDSPMMHERCLAVHLDLAAAVGTPNLVPFRFARIVRADVYGTVVTIKLALEGFSYAPDLAAFRSEFEAQGLVSDQGHCLHYVAGVPLALTTVFESRELAVWQSMVAQLAVRPRFSQEEFFFTLHSIDHQAGRIQDDQGARHQVRVVEGRLALAPASEYRLGFFVYHPAEPNEATLDGRIVVSSSHPDAIGVYGSPIAVDSPYDFAHVHLRTERPDSRKRTILTVRSEAVGGAPVMEFALELPLRRAWGQLVLAVFLLGFLLALPHVTDLIKVPWLRHAIDIGSSFAAAGVAALGLRRIK